MGKRRQRKRRTNRVQLRWRRAKKRSAKAIEGCGRPVHDVNSSARSQIVQTPSTQPTPIYWSPTRVQIRQWLEQYSVPLAELYKAAVELMFGKPFPARIRLIGHCVREIRNGLPYAVATERLPKRGRFDYQQAADKLAEKWRRDGLSLAGDAPGLDAAQDASEIPLSPDEPISISRDLFDSLGRFLADHEAVNVKQEQAALCLFEACFATSTSATVTGRHVVRSWLNVTGIFMGLTHESGKALSDSEEAEMRDRFDEFEGYLASFSRTFFENFEELDVILEDTNSRTD